MTQKANLIWILASIALIGTAILWRQAAQAQTCDPNLDYIQIGETAFNSGDFNGALAAYTCSVQLAPTSPRALNRRGWTYYQLGNYRAAWEDFNQAIALDPTYPYPYNNRGLVYHYWGDYSAALADFDQAIALNHQPLSVPQEHRERTLAALGENPAPVVLPTVTLRASIEVTAAPPTLAPTGETPQLILPTMTPITTQNEEATLQEALRQYRAGDYEGATTTFSLLEQNSSTICHRSYMFMVLGSYDYALLYLTEAINSGLGCNSTRAYRTYVLTQLGDLDEAALDYNRAKTQDLNWMGHLYLLASDPLLQGKVNSIGLDDWYQLFEEITDEAPLQLDDDPVTIQMRYLWAYRFPFEGQSGQTVTLTATDASNDVVDVMIALIGPDGLVIALNDDSDLGFDAMLENFELPADGEYTLVVTHAGGGSEGPVEVVMQTGESAD